MPIRLTQIIKVLIITCFVLFVVQQTGDQFFRIGILDFFSLKSSTFFHGHQFWQLFTYSFFHHDVMHLFFNMMMLAFIGSELEAAWGSYRLIRYLSFCVLASGVSYLLLSLFLGHGSTPFLGTTGAIYGLLMAYGFTYGEKVLLFMMLFPMKAKHFVWVLALLQLMTTVYSGESGFASIGHLSGMLAGFGYLWVRTIYILSKKTKQKQAISTQSKKRKNQHLKLIVNNRQNFDPKEDESEDDPKTWH